MSGAGREVAILLSPVRPAPGGSGRALRAWDWVRELSATHDLQVWIPGPADAEPQPPLPEGVTLWYGEQDVLPVSPGRRRLGWLLPPLARVTRGAVVADWLLPRPGGDPFAPLLAALGGRKVARLVVFRLYLHPLGRALRERLEPGSWELDMDDHESTTRLSVAGAQWRLGRPLEALLRAAEALQYRLLEGRVAASYDRLWLAAPEDLAPLRAGLTSQGARALAAAAVQHRPNHLPPGWGREDAAASPARAASRLARREEGSPLGPPQRLELLFVGGLDYPPNEEALRFLLRAVLPALDGRLAQPWRLTVVGRRPGATVRRELGRQPGVELWSELEDLSACYAASDLVLVPLFAGGGSKLKTLEAFAYGCAVVASAEGVRGLGAVPGREYRPAASAPDFIAAIVELAKDTGARRALGRAAAAFYRRYAGI